MNSNNLANQTAEISLQRTARIAGFMFLFSLLFPVLNWTFVLSKLIVPGNMTATADNILSHELLFRISIVNELILAISIVVTALVLYVLLKKVNKDIALLALILRLAEAVITIFIGLFRFIVLQGLTGEEYLTAINPETLKIWAAFLLNVHTSLTASFTMLFIGLGLSLYNYLFLKSNYVPRTIAGFGIFSYLLIFVYALINIFIPGHSNTLQIICWGPSILFEFIIGVWLIFKGIKVQQMN